MNEILTPSYLRLTFKHVLFISRILKTASQKYRLYYMYKAERSSISILSPFAHPFKILSLSLSLAPIIRGSQNFHRKITTKISLSERLLVICSEIMDLPGVLDERKRRNIEIKKENSI